MSETAHNLPIRKALLLTTVVTAGIALCVNAARDAMPKRSDAEVAAMRTIIARASYTEGLYCDGEHYSPLRALVNKEYLIRAYRNKISEGCRPASQFNNG